MNQLRDGAGMLHHGRQHVPGQTPVNRYSDVKAYVRTLKQCGYTRLNTTNQTLMSCDMCDGSGLANCLWFAMPKQLIVVRLFKKLN